MIALEEEESPLKFSELLDFAELLEGGQQKSAKEFSTKYVL